MLLKTIQEVKSLLPRLLTNVQANSLLPDFDRAEQKHLVPITGPALLQQFVALYQANTQFEPGDFRATIMKNMQRLVAAHAFLDELGFMGPKITDSGIQAAQTANMPRVFGWEFNKLENALRDVAADSVDVLLQSLWLNRAQLENWTASEPFKTFKGLLIKTASQFNSIHQLQQPQRTFFAIRSTMQMVQEQVISQAVGEPLAAYFVATDDLAPAEINCLAYLQKALAFYTIKRACEHYAVKITDAGFTIVSNGDPQNLDAAGQSSDQGKMGGFLQMKMDACERDGAAYLAKARAALIALGKDAAAPAPFMTAFNASKLAAVATASIYTKNKPGSKIVRL